MKKANGNDYGSKYKDAANFSEWMCNEIIERMNSAGFTLSDWQQEGERDVYLRARVLNTSKPVQIFVYTDEVGFLFGDEWVIAENPDFPDRGTMLEWLMGQLFLRIRPQEA